MQGNAVDRSRLFLLPSEENHLKHWPPEEAAVPDLPGKKKWRMWYWCDGAGTCSTVETSPGSDSDRQAGSLRPRSPWIPCQAESELSSLVGRAQPKGIKRQLGPQKSAR